LADFAFAFMDCEFGGLDPELHDITEIAVIVTDYRLAELAAGEWKIAARPHRISPESAEISGYRAEDWQGAPHIREVLAAIDALLPAGKTVVPAGQNVRMDVSFLERAYRMCERAYPFDYHVIDLATLFYTWSLVAGEPVAALSLRQAAINAGLIDGPVPHRAMADARLTLDTFRHYVGRLALRPLSDAPAPVSRSRPRGPSRRASGDLRAGCARSPARVPRAACAGAP
jgi:oligoribonuclease (3'-5' exoribonuclease)